MLKMLPIAGRQIASRCRLDVGGLAYTTIAQEVEQMRHLARLTAPRLSTNTSLSTPTAALVSLDVRFAEISHHYTALREPTVERYCVPCLNVNDARRVLLVDQPRDKLPEMACQRTSGAANESRDARIRSFHDVLLAGGSARQGGLLCPVLCAANAEQVHGSDGDGT